MRKAIITFVTVFGLVLPSLSSSGDEGYYSRSYTRLSYVKGDVYVQRAQDLGYEEGVVNLAVIEGDMLGTREGWTEIHLGKNNYLRLDFDTQVEAVRLPRRDDNLTKLHLLKGNMYVRIHYLDYEKSFEVHTPDASFYILKEGLYRFDVKEDSKTELFVYEGAAEAAGEEDSLLVENRERIVASEGIFQSKPTFFSSLLNGDFAEWNENRDSLLNMSVAKTYLPPDLYEYEAELAANGQWEYEEPYGHVWVPYVSHYTWRPYYYGRWVWYPIIGWNWVSNDPWGWCVYHYGRWHWRMGLGWYWIPTPVWGPAWVYWYWGYDYLGWCPISYYDYPVVIINNIFYGRYYSRDYPLRSRALVVVRKGQMQARDVSKVALKTTEIKRIGKVSLTTKNPGVKPVIKSVSNNPEAARVLSRSPVRKIERAFTPGKRILSASRQISSPSRVSEKKLSSRSIKKYPATTPPPQPERPATSRMEKSISSRSSSLTQRVSPSTRPIKTYERSVSSHRVEDSPKKSISTYQPKITPTGPRTDKPSVKIYKPQTSLSSNYSPSRSNTSNSRYVSPQKSSTTTTTSPFKNYISQRYSSPSHSYRPPSNNPSRQAITSRSISSGNYTSKSYSSTSRSSSTYSRPSITSRSSSRSSSSSSTSSSTSRIKKK